MSKEFRKKQDKSKTSVVSSDAVPPHDLNAERGVIGSILLDENNADLVLDVVRSDDFYSDAHQRIMATIARIRKAGDPIDLLLLVNKLSEYGELEAVGGAEYFADLMASVHVSAHVEHYARIVRKKSQMRRYAIIASEMMAKAYQEDVLPSDVRALIDKAVSEEDYHGDFRIVSAKDGIMAVAEDMDTDKPTNVLPTGFRKLDSMLCGGVRAGNYVVVAARPSVGKSTYMLNMAVTQARTGIPVGIVSLEMPAKDILKRAVATESEVPLNRIMQPDRLNKTEWQNVIKTHETLSELPLFFYDLPNCRMDDLFGLTRSMIRKHGIKVLYVDYLGLIRNEKNASRYDRMTDISGHLKVLALVLNIPVVVLAQLNREATRPKTAGKLDSKKLQMFRPRLEHLRDTGAVEQDADVAILLHRPEMMLSDDEIEGLGVEGNAEFIVAKNRQGRRGIIEGTFSGEYCRFNEESTSEPEPEEHPEFAAYSGRTQEYRPPYSDSDDDAVPMVF